MACEAPSWRINVNNFTFVSASGHYIPDNTVCALSNNILDIVLLADIERNLSRSRGIGCAGRHLDRLKSITWYIPWFELLKLQRSLRQRVAQLQRRTKYYYRLVRFFVGSFAGVLLTIELPLGSCFAGNSSVGRQRFRARQRYSGYNRSFRLSP